MDGGRRQNPANAVAGMQGASEQLPPPAVLTEQFNATLNLLHTDATKGKAPGVNDEADWQQTISVFTQAGVVTKAQPPSAYWDVRLRPEGMTEGTTRPVPETRGNEKHDRPGHESRWSVRLNDVAVRFRTKRRTSRRCGRCRSTSRRASSSRSSGRPAAGSRLC